MLVLGTKAEYEAILFNPTIKLIENKRWSKGEQTISLVCEGVTIAKRTTGRTGNHIQVDRTYLDIK